MTLLSSVLSRMVCSGTFLLIFLLAGFSASVQAIEIRGEEFSQGSSISDSENAALQQTQTPDMPSLPMLFAEGSNSCEIVSCGMGIKQTCQITCPAEKTPKCSCDCERNIGPLCMDYKANCRCE
ncbi:MAG: exported protein of unknown function [Nitrospira sp.]|jgi:hypothetical protein|nr:exported protein of unknown function [Nitrospira sp.]